MEKINENNGDFKLKEKINKLKSDLDWYRVWHEKFKEKIAELTTELETYRPTELSGDGQCSCYGCEQKIGFNRHWTTGCYQYKGHVYCSSCIEEVLKQEQKARTSPFENEIAKWKQKWVNSEQDSLDKYAQIKQLDQEIGQLQEQLINAIVPKYHVGQEIYYLGQRCVYSSRIEAIKIKIINGVRIQYKLLSKEGYKNYRNECDLFASEFEAREHLEKRQ